MKKKIVAMMMVVVFLMPVPVAQATVPQTQTVLESYFQTGLRPTQAQYQEFIDTMFWYANQTYTNSLLAAQQLGQVNSLYQAYANVTLNVGTGIVPAFNSNFNIKSMTVTNAHLGTGPPAYAGMGHYLCNIVFSNALPGVNYRVQFSAPASVPIEPGTGQIQVDGLNPSQTNVLAYVTTTTNFEFFMYSLVDANFNGLSLRFTFR